MEDYTGGGMNLDLNLGPLSPTSGGSAPGNGTLSPSGENINLEDDMVGHSFHHRFRVALRQRNRQRWRWRDWGNSDVPIESQVASGAAPAAGHDINGMMHTGEGSNPSDVPKISESTVSKPEDETTDMKKDIEKGISGDSSSFFDCNICLDLAKEPIVTSCGHLFCWPCLYRWLHIHSDAKECPVCKGEVTVKNVTPIFGKGEGVAPESGNDKIPDRPPARRVESLRQAIQRTALSIPMEEMIRRLGSRFDLSRDLFQPEEGEGPRVMNTLLHRILTSRGLRREQNVAPLDGEGEESRPEMETESRRLQSYRGPHTAVPPSADRFVETVIRTPPSVDDRDSFSSITAAIHGESQTVDTAVEINSTVSLSTSSSSRRRNDASRVSDVDSGDSRLPRRRRRIN